MVALETTIQEQASELVIVFGDVNSTMGGAIVAAKLCVKIAHVESGLRSFDRTMPEEINRIVTDHLSDYLFVSEPSGLENLKREGIADGKVFFTGNIMIDSLLSTLDVVKRSDVVERLGLTPRRYAVMTLHRPSNVDDPATLGALLGTVSEVSARMPVVFPCHPRTRHNIEKFGLGASLAPSVVMTEPLGYTDFSRLTYESAFVLTDSGGIQEETTFLKVPCITMRDNTERPVTVTVGSNVMTGNDRSRDPRRRPRGPRRRAEACGHPGPVGRAHGRAHCRDPQERVVAGFPPEDTTLSSRRANAPVSSRLCMWPSACVFAFRSRAPERMRPTMRATQALMPATSAGSAR